MSGDLDWIVDFETSTVSHRDGWIFVFSRSIEDPDCFEGVCIGQPEFLSAKQLHKALQIAKAAAMAYVDALAARH